MTTGRGSDSVGQLNNTECCMCGDLGFSDQLFQCKVCQFRSQHRYCSNLYPKDESLGTCNWCLSQKEDNTKEKSPNSSNSSSSHKNNTNETSCDESNKTMKRIKKGLIRGSNSSSSVGLHHQMLKPIKKQKSQDAIRLSPPPSSSKSQSQSPSQSPSTRKRIVTNGALEERLRRTKSEGIIAANRSGVGVGVGIATKQVFRNKVRRYKLLDEVSS